MMLTRNLTKKLDGFLLVLVGIEMLDKLRLIGLILE